MMNYEIFKEVVKEKFMDYMPEKFKGMELVTKAVMVKDAEQRLKVYLSCYLDKEGWCCRPG